MARTFFKVHSWLGVFGRTVRDRLPITETVKAAGVTGVVAFGTATITLLLSWVSASNLYGQLLVLLAALTTAILFLSLVFALSGPRPLFWMSVFGAVFLLVLVAVAVWQASRPEPRMAYVLVDASADTVALISDHRMILAEDVEAVSDTNRVGVWAFGVGPENGACTDIIRPLRESVPLPETPELLDQLVPVKPILRGSGSNLQSAILRVIEKLPVSNNNHEIIVVTSARSPSCEPLNRDVVNTRSVERGITLHIAIVAVGAVTQGDADFYKGFADSNSYINVNSIDETGAAITTITQLPDRLRSSAHEIYMR